MTMSMSFKGHFIIAKNVDGQNLEYTSYSAYYTILEWSTEFTSYVKLCLSCYILTTLRSFEVT